MHNRYIMGRFVKGILYLSHIPRIGKVIRIQGPGGDTGENYVITNLTRKRLSGYWDWIVTWDASQAYLETEFKVKRKYHYGYGSKTNGYVKSKLRTKPVT